MSSKFQFLIKLVICCLLAVAVSWGNNSTARAQTSSGWINEHFSYEDLDVKQGIVNSSRHGRVHSCVFSGKIVNTAISERKNVTITFYAINVFNEQLWEESSVHIQSLPPFESLPFSKKNSCQDKAPYKWEIKVVETQEDQEN